MISAARLFSMTEWKYIKNRITRNHECLGQGYGSCPVGCITAARRGHRKISDVGVYSERAEVRAFNLFSDLRRAIGIEDCGLSQIPTESVIARINSFIAYLKKEQKPKAAPKRPKRAAAKPVRRKAKPPKKAVFPLGPGTPHKIAESEETGELVEV